MDILKTNVNKEIVSAQLSHAEIVEILANVVAKEAGIELDVNSKISIDINIESDDGENEFYSSRVEIENDLNARDLKIPAEGPCDE